MHPSLRASLAAPRGDLRFMPFGRKGSGCARLMCGARGVYAPLAQPPGPAAGHSPGSPPSAHLQPACLQSRQASGSSQPPAEVFLGRSEEAGCEWASNREVSPMPKQRAWGWSFHPSLLSSMHQSMHPFIHAPVHTTMFPSSHHTPISSSTTISPGCSSILLPVHPAQYTPLHCPPISVPALRHGSQPHLGCRPARCPVLACPL